MSAVVRPLAAADVPAAVALNRAAFSRFFGLPDPAKFRAGADMIGPRRRLWPKAALALELDGELAGAALMMRWGSVCVLGPVTVAPEHWGKGLARVLVAKLVDIVDDNGWFSLTGLFTHPQSPKHIRLYESFGFRMQRMTAVMAKAIGPKRQFEAPLRYSALASDGRIHMRGQLRELTSGIYPGLDLVSEINGIAAFWLGETLLLSGGDGLDGMAICHFGPGSEASEGQVLVKFAAARGGDGAVERFRRVLAACEAYAAGRGASQVVAGTNTGRAAAYELMCDAGYRTIMNGIAMTRPAVDYFDRPDALAIAMTRPAVDGYNRPDAFAIDDWR